MRLRVSNLCRSSPEAFDGRSNENVAKTVLVEGRNDYRSAVLGPRDVHRSRLIGAVDFNISTRRGEGRIWWGWSRTRAAAAQGWK
jgi:hypothetical protein